MLGKIGAEQGSTFIYLHPKYLHLSLRRSGVYMPRAGMKEHSKSTKMELGRQKEELSILQIFPYLLVWIVVVVLCEQPGKNLMC